MDLKKKTDSGGALKLKGGQPRASQRLGKETSLHKPQLEGKRLGGKSRPEGLGGYRLKKYENSAQGYCSVNYRIVRNT